MDRLVGICIEKKTEMSKRWRIRRINGKSGLIFRGDDNRGCKEKRKAITKEISFNKQ